MAIVASTQICAESIGLCTCWFDRHILGNSHWSRRSGVAAMPLCSEPAPVQLQAHIQRELYADDEFSSRAGDSAQPEDMGSDAVPYIAARKTASRVSELL